MIEKYKRDRSNFKCDYLDYTPSTLNNVRNPNQQSYNVIPAEDSVICLKACYL